LIPTIHRDDVLKQIGYKTPPEENLLHLLDEMLELGHEYLEPLMRFEEIDGSRDLPLFLHGAALSYVALASIGPGLEGRVKNFLTREEPRKGTCSIPWGPLR
jgi:hypothetical protein